MSIFEYVLFFFIYSFIGWCVEVIYAALKSGKFVNRGFLNGCACPIYGAGVILILLCLTPININVFVLFATSVVLTSILEFLTGFVLEKLFHTKWWDYSKEHFNIKGYVCVKYSLLWGIACVIVVDLVHPSIAYCVGKLPDIALYIICGVLSAAFIVDFIFTVIQLVKHDNNYKTISQICAKLKVPSDAIGEKISSATIEADKKLHELKNKIRSSRLFKAFPEQIRKSKNDDACSVISTQNLPDAEERKNEDEQ